jgi:hypothetical protein
LPWDALFHHVMGDKRKVAAGEELPLTGVGEDTDRRLSSIFVEPFDMQVGGLTWFCGVRVACAAVLSRLATWGRAAQARLCSGQV